MISMLITGILLIIAIFFFKNLKKRTDLHVYRYLFFHVMYLLTFFLFFVVLLRLSSFLKQKNIIDIKDLYTNFDYGNTNLIFIIMLLYLLLIIRRIIFFYTKITFLKVHLYFTFLSLKNNFFYHRIFYDFCKLPQKRLFFFMRYFSKIATAVFINNIIFFLLKYSFSIIIILLFLFDLKFNEFKLQYSLIILPYYGLYQLAYMTCCYLMDNLDFSYDLELIKCIYFHQHIDCNSPRFEYKNELPQNLKLYIKKLLS